MRNITVVVAETDAVIMEKIEELMGTSRKFDIMSRTKNASTLLDTVKTRYPQVVILSCDLIGEDGEDAYDVCQKIVAENPSTVVIMTSTYNSMDDLRKAMNAGARSMLFESEIDEKLISSTEELVKSIQKYDSTFTRQDAKVVSIMAAKDGSGKTTSAINLAGHLARMRRPDGSNYKVLVLDADLEFGDVAYLLNVNAKRNFSDLSDMSELDIDALRAHFTEVPEYGYNILSAPKNPRMAGFVQEDVIEQTILLAKKMYDFILIDTPSVLEGAGGAFFKSATSSDFLMVASRNDLIGLKNTKLMMDILDQLTSQLGLEYDKVGVLITRYMKSGLTPKDVSVKFEKNVVGVIPENSELVSTASNQAKLLYDIDKKNPLSVAYQEVAENLISILMPNDIIVEKVVENEKRSFLDKLLKK